MAYAKELGFEKIYLVSDHVNLYEKYGFSVIEKN
jgi:N-acetylglutamate synthase-like GNAT family acetyltransferase